jgi:bifunctional enzyme CysN/CysC
VAPEENAATDAPIDVHSTVAEHAVELATARKDIVRIATAGSVDDGKSTLIGRLLYDSKAIFEDQYEAVARASKGDHVDLALLTDGLRAEREQGITIDVAYRYFTTPRRTFILADTPGHVQYTRNMVTGASTADLAIVLVDARKGMVEQSRRHAFLASLLRVPHLVVAVNKMDLVDWSEEVFDGSPTSFSAFAAKLSVPDLTVVPISRCTATTSSPTRELALVRGPDAAAPPRARARGQRPQPHRRPVPRCSTSSGRRPRSTTTTAATRAPSPAGCSAPATRCRCCPAA